MLCDTVYTKAHRDVRLPLVRCSVLLGCQRLARGMLSRTRIVGVGEPLRVAEPVGLRGHVNDVFRERLARAQGPRLR